MMQPEYEELEFCRFCGGKGFVSYRNRRKCARCNGTGRTLILHRLLREFGEAQRQRKDLKS